MKKGIVDPWRITTPIQPKKEDLKKVTKRDVTDQDFEADLRIPGQHRFQGEFGSIKITSHQIRTQSDAVAVLGDCLEAIKKKYKSDFLEKFTIRTTTDVHASESFSSEEWPGFIKTGPGYEPKIEIRFMVKEYGRAILCLLELFKEVKRRGGGDLLKKYGIEPIQR